MKSFLLLIILLSTVSSSFAQQTATITYDVKYHGKPVPGSALKLFIDGKKAHLQRVADPNAKEQYYLDYAANRTLQILTMQNGAHVTQQKDFKDYEQPELLADTETILGYACKKAKVIIRSNTVEVWYTNALPLKGTPSIGVTPGLGLVLKTIRNGEQEVVATNISLSKVKPANLA